jgi:hypothetical protein
MMADELAHLLDRFAGHWGLEPPLPDTPGNYVLELDGRLRLTLTQVGAQVFLEGSPGTLPADGYQAGEQLRTLMSASLAGLGRSDEVLSLDPNNDGLVLFRCLPLPELALDALERELEGFANRLDFLMQHVPAPPASLPAPLTLTILYP